MPSNEALIAELKDEIAYLRGELGLALDATKIHRLRKYFPGAGRVGAAMLLMLYAAKERGLSVLQLLEGVPREFRNDNIDNIDQKQVSVVICRMRARMGDDVFENIWGFGYRLTEVGRKVVEEALGERLAA